MIIHDESGYEVKGTFEMHGIKRKMMFPFKVRIAIDQTSKRELLDLQGVWIINRKDFNIIWNKYLDQGGIVVGDLLTVAWGLRIPTHIRG
jgi:polyisoprenoid-binding protein YceI